MRAAVFAAQEQSYNKLKELESERQGAINEIRAEEAAAAISALQFELDNYKSFEAKKEATLKESILKQNDLEAALLKGKYENNLISKAEYDSGLLTLEQTKNDKLQEITDKARLLDEENRFALQQDSIFAELELERQKLESKKITRGCIC